MTKVIALCGTAGSGKTMLCEHFVKDNPQRKYIRTTTTKVRERYNSPSYSYLMSKEGFELMKEYQEAIADNLWNELFLGVEAVNEEYYYALLDRTPIDAYLYEAIFTLNSQHTLQYEGKEVTPYMWAWLRTIEEYKKREELLGTPILFVGLSSMFVTDDPKRPPYAVNMYYKNQVMNLFSSGKQKSRQWLEIAALPSTYLEINARGNLLNRVIMESFK